MPTKTDCRFRGKPQDASEASLGRRRPDGEARAPPRSALREGEAARIRALAKYGRASLSGRKSGRAMGRLQATAEHEWPRTQCTRLVADARRLSGMRVSEDYEMTLVVRMGLTASLQLHRSGGVRTPSRRAPTQKQGAKDSNARLRRCS